MRAHRAKSEFLRKWQHDGIVRSRSLDLAIPDLRDPLERLPRVSGNEPAHRVKLKTQRPLGGSGKNGCGREAGQQRFSRIAAGEWVCHELIIYMLRRLAVHYTESGIGLNASRALYTLRPV